MTPPINVLDANFDQPSVTQLDQPQRDMPKLEKGIPLPPPKTGTRNGRWLQFAKQMEVGDSALCQLTGKQKWPYLAIVLRKLGYEVATRKEGEHMRVWRTK